MLIFSTSFLSLVRLLAVTGGGLEAPTHFFRLLFPLMLFILIVFRVGIFVSGDRLKRPFGVILIACISICDNSELQNYGRLKLFEVSELA